MLNTFPGAAPSSDVHERRAEAHLRATVKGFRALPESRLSIALAQQVRQALDEVAHDMTTKVRARIKEYSGKPSGRREQLIALAATAAIEQFLDIIEGKTDSTSRTQELFRKMGYGSAFEGHRVNALHSAVQIAMFEAWQRLRDVAAVSSIPSALLVNLIDLMLAYTDALCEQVALGYASATRALERDPVRVRARLASGLLSGASTIELSEDSVKAGWPLPDQFVVAAVHDRQTLRAPDLTSLPSTFLTHESDNTTFVVSAAHCADSLVTALQNLQDSCTAAISPAVDIATLPDAARWSARTLTLVQQGVIPASPVIGCEEHFPQLWLHADPRLRDRLVQAELAPLLAQSGNSRNVLSETMLLWLSTRDSAAGLARALHIHPQTVRYRLKRITDMFGPKLDDPSSAFLLTMLLKASLPRWRAGDPSDIERFWSRKGAYAPR